MFKKIAALAPAAVLCAGLMARCGASSTTADTSYSAREPAGADVWPTACPRPTPSTSP